MLKATELDGPANTSQEDPVNMSEEGPCITSEEDLADLASNSGNSVLLLDLPMMIRSSSLKENKMLYMIVITFLM